MPTPPDHTAEFRSTTATLLRVYSTSPQARRARQSQDVVRRAEASGPGSLVRQEALEELD